MYEQLLVEDHLLGASVSDGYLLLWLAISRLSQLLLESRVQHLNSINYSILEFDQY